MEQVSSEDKKLFEKAQRDTLLFKLFHLSSKINGTTYNEEKEAFDNKVWDNFNMLREKRDSENS